MSNPIVSLCMPTNGVIEWVFPVLDSVYEQGCDNKEFEIIITDNGNNKEFKEKIKSYNQQHSNLYYYETNALPFINEIESYKRATGQLIKFVNHRTLLKRGALQRLIDYAKKYADIKPILYFANGVLKKEKKSMEYNTFDQFVNALSYWSSWSTGMAIWKEDFDKLPEDVGNFNELFILTGKHICVHILYGKRHFGRVSLSNAKKLNKERKIFSMHMTPFPTQIRLM